MKKRVGFVSNSSSSSFIIVDPSEELLKFLQDGYSDYLEVFGETKNNLINRLLLDGYKVKDSSPIYVTNYIDDCCETYDVHYNFSGVYEYCEGHYNSCEIEGYNTEFEGELGVGKIYILNKDLGVKDEN